MRNACFCFSRPPILVSKTHPKIMLFLDLPGQTFLWFYVDFMRKWSMQKSLQNAADLHFPILAAQWLQNTWFVWFLQMRRKPREAPIGLTLQNPPSGANAGYILASLRSQNMFLKTHWFVDAFGLPFGSLLVPFWFQVAPCCSTFGTIFYILSSC